MLVMVMETIENVVANLGTADIDKRLEEQLIDVVLGAPPRHQRHVELIVRVLVPQEVHQVDRAGRADLNHLTARRAAFHRKSPEECPAQGRRLRPFMLSLRPAIGQGNSLESPTQHHAAPPPLANHSRKPGHRQYQGPPEECHQPQSQLLRGA